MKILILLFIVLLMAINVDANYIMVEEVSNSTHREIEYNDNNEVISVTEVTVCDGFVYKVGVHITDGTAILNPDDVSFYLVDPDAFYDPAIVTAHD